MWALKHLIKAGSHKNLLSMHRGYTDKVVADTLVKKVKDRWDSHRALHLPGSRCTKDDVSKIISEVLGDDKESIAKVGVEIGEMLKNNGEPEHASLWFQFAADQGSARGHFFLGNLCYDKQVKLLLFFSDFAKDFKEAFEHFHKAASLGHRAAAHNLGNLLRSDNNIPFEKDDEQAERWFRFAADEGLYRSIAAYFSLRHRKDPSLEQPESKLALERLQCTADQGDISCAHALGKYLFSRKDYIPAAKYLKKVVARVNEPESMLMLGMMYCDGDVRAGENDEESPEKTTEVGLALLHACLEKGMIGAYLYLGGYYENGKKVARDLKKSRHYFREAARSGNPIVMRDFGSMIVREQLDGEETLKDGVDLLFRAASQGETRAQLLYALASLNPKTKNAGIEFDFEKAKEWVRAEAMKGNPHGIRLYSELAASLKSFDPDEEMNGIFGYWQAEMDKGNEPRIRFVPMFPRNSSQIINHLKNTVDLSPEDAFELGRLYCEGKARAGKNNEESPEKTFEIGLKLIHEASDKGDELAHLYLGHLYDRGEKIERDQRKSRHYFRILARAGHSSAVFELGWRILKEGSLEGEETREEGMRLMMEAALKGHTWAGFLLQESQRAARNGDGAMNIDSATKIGSSHFEQRNYTEALPHLQKATDGGNLEAMRLLAKCHHDGLGVKEDKTKASELEKRASELEQKKESRRALREASRTGDTTAMLELGNKILGEQLEGEENRIEGLEIIRKALSGSNAQVCARQEGNEVIPLLVLPLDGHDNPIMPSWPLEPQQYASLVAHGGQYFKQGDYVKAIPFLKKAAGGGDARGITLLGECYRLGRGVDKDEVKAFQLFKEASERDWTTAMILLAEAYMQGSGTEQNHRLGFEWAEKANCMGRKEALSIMGRAYDIGLGVPVDKNKAIDCWEESVIELEDYGSALALIQATQQNDAKHPSEEAIQRAIDVLKRELLTKQEHPDKMFFLNFLSVYGTDEDRKAIIEILRGLSDPEALLAIGTSLFYLGRGEESIPHLRAASAFYPKCAFFLAVTYYNTRTREAGREAFKYAKIASDAGLPDAHFLMQQIYKHGVGVEKNEKESERYFELALLAGQPNVVEEDKARREAKTRLSE